MSKQDRQGVRTAQALEQKYQFGKQFAELMGIALDARESVDSLASTLRSEMLEQVTSIIRDTEEILLTALQNYTLTEDTEKLEETLKSELSIMAERIAMNFETTTQQITTVDGELKTIAEELEKHFEFSVDGLTIKAGENAMKLLLDNDMIRFTKNGQEFGWWDGVDFHTGNIVVKVNERAQFGDFAFVPRSNGSLDFLKVGG